MRERKVWKLLVQLALAEIYIKSTQIITIIIIIIIITNAISGKRIEQDNINRITRAITAMICTKKLSEISCGSTREPDGKSTSQITRSRASAAWLLSPLMRVTYTHSCSLRIQYIYILIFVERLLTLKYNENHKNTKSIKNVYKQSKQTNQTVETVKCNGLHGGALVFQARQHLRNNWRPLFQKGVAR
jgi:hypothetical protein